MTVRAEVPTGEIRGTNVQSFGNSASTIGKARLLRSQGWRDMLMQRKDLNLCVCWNGACSCLFLRSVTQLIVDDAPERLYAILPRNLLSFFVGAPRIADRHLVHARDTREEGAKDSVGYLSHALTVVYI